MAHAPLIATPLAHYAVVASGGEGREAALLGALEMLISGQQRPDKAVIQHLREAVAAGAAGSAAATARAVPLGSGPGADAGCGGGGGGCSSCSSCSSSSCGGASASTWMGVSPPGTPSRGCSCSGSAGSDDGLPAGGAAAPQQLRRAPSGAGAAQGEKRRPSGGLLRRAATFGGLAAASLGLSGGWSLERSRLSTSSPSCHARRCPGCGSDDDGSGGSDGGGARGGGACADWCCGARRDGEGERRGGELEQGDEDEKERVQARTARMQADAPTAPFDGDDGAGLFNDPQPPEVQQALAAADAWQWDAFALDAATGGRPLSTLAAHLIGGAGLVRALGLDAAALGRWLRAIEAGYGDNPFHHKTHAADVLQTMHVLLTRGGLLELLQRDPLAHLAALLAAVVHDFRHRRARRPASGPLRDA
ncbi:hypothetical protein MNEG_7837, partial [Monoraphidium neglectum]